MPSSDFNFNRVTHIKKISDMCKESYPCSHFVELVIKDDKEEIEIKTSLDATEIAYLYHKLELPLPKHFRGLEKHHNYRLLLSKDKKERKCLIS